MHSCDLRGCCHGSQADKFSKELVDAVCDDSRGMSWTASGNCTGGHVPLCKPRLIWDHGVGAYGVHERELLVHFFYGVRG